MENTALQNLLFKSHWSNSDGPKCSPPITVHSGCFLLRQAQFTLFSHELKYRDAGQQWTETPYGNLGQQKNVSRMHTPGVNCQHETWAIAAFL